MYFDFRIGIAAVVPRTSKESHLLEEARGDMMTKHHIVDSRLRTIAVTSSPCQKKPTKPAFIGLTRVCDIHLSSTLSPTGAFIA